MSENKKVYILQVVTGQENKIKQALSYYIDNEGLGESFGKILVPSEDVSEYRDGEKRTVKRKHFPGYIFIEMESNDDLFFKVSRLNVTGIKGFVKLGNDNKPRAVEPAEAERLLGENNSASLANFRHSKLEVGQQVVVTSGPFKDFSGTVEELNHDKQKVKVSVLIFGRATPVELDFFQVECSG